MSSSTTKQRRPFAGQVHGRLTVLEMVLRKGTATKWLCRCECGALLTAWHCNIIICGVRCKACTPLVHRWRFRNFIKRSAIDRANWILTADVHSLAPYVAEVLESLPCSSDSSI